MEGGCSSTQYLLTSGSTAGQAKGHEHRNFHCINDEAPTEAYGRAFLAFHRQFISDFDNWRLKYTSYGRLEPWDPYPNALVPGDDENYITAFTNCSDANMPNPGNNIRPAGAMCTACSTLPSIYVGSNLDTFTSLGQLGYTIDTGGPNYWHGTYHNGVSMLGCDDIGGFIHTPRDPAFWMAHKKLDEIARDWQSLQATDVVIVIDRSGSMDDNCSSTTPPLSETPCAINDAREAARTFANLVLDERMESGIPAAEQHRIGLVSFSSTSTMELALTPAAGIVGGGSTFDMKLDAISTGGLTSVAAGIREALAILNVPDRNDHQAILVLTDGQENTSPCLGGNSPSLCVPAGAMGTLTAAEVGDVQIVAVGFAGGAAEANLRDVAERHGGIFVAESNVNDPLSMQKFFVTAFGEIFDSGTSVDPREVLPSGQMESAFFPIEVCGTDDRLSVVMGSEQTVVGAECDLMLELFTPSGVQVDRLAAGVEAGHGARHDFIHVELPYRSESTGTWFGRVVRTGQSSPNCPSQEYFYSVLIKGFGRIEPLVVRPDVIVGRPILATFRITESNRPIGGFDAVQASLELVRADGPNEFYPLFDDGTNGDSMANNHIWSFEVPNVPTVPGIYHLRAHFEVTKDGCTSIRESEYSITVEDEHPDCAVAGQPGTVNALQLHRTQPGETHLVPELFCLANRCGSEGSYDIEISDTNGWLQTSDPNTGGLMDLPPIFRSNLIPSFQSVCFGRGPDEGNPDGVLPIFVSIPPSAQIGDRSAVSIKITPLGDSNQGPFLLSGLIEAFPPPDCNDNGIDDAIDIADGAADENGNGVPDICEQAAHPVTTDDATIPGRQSLVLFQNRPNPFNPLTEIRFALDRPGLVSLKIHNARGHLVDSVAGRHFPAGEHSLTWDGRDLNGREAPSGVYFFTIEGLGERVTRRMVLLE